MKHMNTELLPNLDTDDLTYRYSKVPDDWTRPRYTVSRSINGGSFHVIGEVYRQSESTWHSSATWVAKAGYISSLGTTRSAAVTSLEQSLQPEWLERRAAAYRVQSAERSRRLEAGNVDAERRVRVLDRTDDAAGGYFLVILDGNLLVAKVAVRDLFDAHAAKRAAEAIGETLKANVRSAVLNATS